MSDQNGVAVLEAAESRVEETETPAPSVGADTDAELTPAAPAKAAEPTKTETENVGRRISISVRALTVAALILFWAASMGVLAWLYLGEKGKVDATAQQDANYHRAEQISLDYAVKAAKIDYKDLEAWKRNLVENTTPQLHEKLADAGKSMEQLLVPLQWSSTVTPLVAKVRSADKGVYVVDTFVGVNTKTMQAPEGLQSTATYSVTVDGNQNWQVSEVGGIGSVVGQK